MRSWTTALTLLVAAGTASAQPAPGEPPPGPAPMDPAPPPPLQEPAPPHPPMSPPPPAPPPAPAPEAASDHRPSGLSIGIGLGYALPVSLQTPNVTSVRIRLATGLTFEPRLAVSRSSEEVDTGMSVENKQSSFGIGALGRYPMVRRGRVDLEILGGLDVNQVTTTPEAPDSDLSITTFNAVYGLAVGAWINRHLQVSLSALNPILSITRRDEEMGLGTNTVTTTSSIGLIFQPDVLLMVHLHH